MMDGSVRSPLLLQREVLTTAFYTPSPFVIEDINLFLRPASSMLSRSRPSRDRSSCLRTINHALPPPSPSPSGDSGGRTYRKLPAVSPMSLHSPVKPGRLSKE